MAERSVVIETENLALTPGDIDEARGKLTDEGVPNAQDAEIVSVSHEIGKQATITFKVDDVAEALPQPGTEPAVSTATKATKGTAKVSTDQTTEGV